MSFFKKISILVLLVVASVITTTVFAQNIPNLPPVPTTVSEEVSNINSQAQAEVYVNDLVLSKSEYSAGDTVNGSFVLFNNRDQAVSDVYYEIALAGNYQENTLAGTFYDSKKSGPYYLQGKESKKIDFSYTLPKAVAGDKLGIQVLAFLGNGFSMGWRDYPIKVSGEMSFLNITQAAVSIGSDKFALAIGPTVYKNEKAFLEITLKNPTLKTIEVKPKIDVYNRASLDIVQVLETTSVQVSPNGYVNLKYELPKFNDKAGVYVGRVDFLDLNNIKRATDFNFRYVIGGDIATIVGFTVDKTGIRKGDEVKATLTYSGSVIDVRNPNQDVNASYDVNVKLFSESNKLVAETTELIDFNKGGEKVFVFNAQNKAESIRSEVVVKKGDAILAEYKSELIKVPTENSKKTNYVYLIGVITLALILVFWVAFSSLGFVNKIILILSLIVLGVLIPIYYAKSFVVDGSAYGTAGDSPTSIQIFVNSPSGSYAPGATYYLTGSASAVNCANQFLAMEYFYARETASNWTYGASATNLTGWADTTNTIRRSGSFSIGPFSAENNAGGHHIHLLAWAYPYWGGIKYDQGSYQHGHQDYNVVIPAVNGACGSSNGSSFSSAPSSNLCSVGSNSAVSGSGPWSWYCYGSNGGSNAYCSANLAVVNGVCGTANGIFLKSAPTSTASLCSSGYVGSGLPTGLGPWTWTCNSMSGGSTANCSANVLNLSCLVNPTEVNINETITLTASSSAPIFSYLWQGADFESGKTTVSISGSYSTAGYKYPTVTATSLSGIPITVGCPGVLVGTRNDFTPGIRITNNGKCNPSYNNHTFDSLTSSSSLCSNGAISSFAGTGPWTWTCLGQYGFSSQSCRAESSSPQQLNCSLVMAPASSTVSINTNTTWVASSVPDCPTCIKTWRQIDSNNPAPGVIIPVTNNTSNILNRIFTTTGNKIISVSFSSNPNSQTLCVAGSNTSASTNVVQSGSVVEQ